MKCAIAVSALVTVASLAQAGGAPPYTRLAIGRGSVYEGQQIFVGMPSFSSDDRLGCTFFTTTAGQGFWMEREILYVDHKDETCGMELRFAYAAFNPSEEYIGISSVGGNPNSCDEAILVNNQFYCVEGQQAPDQPAGRLVESVYDPFILDDGSAYWRALMTDGDNNYHAHYRYDPADSSVTSIFEEGTIVGTPPETRAVLRGSIGPLVYSRDGAHEAFAFRSGEYESALAVDNEIIRYASITDPTTAWNGFATLDMNIHGDFTMSGRADDGSTTHPFGEPAYGFNGDVVLRDSDGLLGAELSINISLDPAPPHLNDAGQAVFLCSLRFPGEAVFRPSLVFAADASRLGETARILVRNDDEVDTDGDGIADGRIRLPLVTDANDVDISPSGNRVAFNGLFLPEGTTNVYHEGNFVMELPLSVADLVPPFGVQDLDDVTGFVDGFMVQDPVSDMDNNGVFELEDIVVFVEAF